MNSAPSVSLQGDAAINGKRLFEPLALHLGAGEWTCLLGGSGVGKSTVLRFIAGLQTEAVLNGSIVASDSAEVSSRVAYMAQDDLLLPWASVSENVVLGARLRGEGPSKERLQLLLERAGLTSHAHKKSDALSGGQRQRVALARTLMEDKPIVLLDEPFSALDAKTRAEMQDLAVELLRGKTVFIVTHDPAEAARLGDAIFIMTPENLHEVSAPLAPIPRPVDDLATLECQARLLRLLRSCST